MTNLFKLPWKLHLIPFVSDDLSKKLPLYGPLNIENYNKYLDDGKQIFNECFHQKFHHRISLSEFTFIHCIAKGGFGKIILVERKNEEKTLYAMKSVSKSFIITHNCISVILNEKRMLQSIQCPFCITLEFLAQSSSHIYLFMPFISGGDLFTQLRKSAKFDETRTKFYSAQIVLAIEFLQKCDVIHRDLKPENVLLDHFGFIKIADFGLAKVVTSRTYTFCGTVAYAAPELILGKGYGKTVDWWSLGIFIFEMASGEPPFTGDDDLIVLERILLSDLAVPQSFSSNLKLLVRGLLDKDPTKRLGTLWRGAEEVKAHPWFKDINWMDLLNRKVVPPFVPDVSSRLGEKNFPQMTSISQISISRPSILDHFFKDF